MPILDKNRIYDGFEALEGGVDAGRRPNIIGPNQCASADNVSFRGGIPKTRPGIRHLPINFPELIYYDSNGLPSGPPTVFDANASGTTLFSPTALFTAADVGSPLSADFVSSFATITAVLGPRTATMSESVALLVTNQTVTFIWRTRPITFLGNYTSFSITSLEANFTQADVGLTISGGTLPAGTTILQVYNPETVGIAPFMLSATGVTLTMPERKPHRSSREVFENGIMQCACYYSPHIDNEYLIALVGGRLFRLIPSDYEVTIDEIKLDKQNRSEIPRGCVIQADKWVVAQDNESRAIIYDGVSAHRAAEDEVPTGELMAYGMGRIVVTKNGQDIFFGDLYGSNESGDPGDAVIKFTETTFLTEGFPATVPFALGKITALSFFPQLDTSTGTGQLFVFTDRGACGFDLSKPREQWKTSAFQQVTLASTGVRGWRSIQALNEDLWFRASDGARTFRQARSESHGYTHIPLSTNVRQWLDSDTPELLDFASATIFDNRFILTCSPIWNHGRVYHNGLLSLDFDILSSFGENARPSWEGHWTKLKTSQLVSGIFKGRRRSFVFGIDGQAKNQMYEITNDKADYDSPITSELVSRSFDFSRDRDSGGRATSSAYSEKELYGGDLWINRVGDHDSSIRVWYRPDGYSEWLPFDDINMMDIQGEWQDMTEGMEPTMRPGFYPRNPLEKPEKPPDPMTKRLLTRGFEFQTKFNWTGYMEIERFRIAAQQMTENSRAK